MPDPLYYQPIKELNIVGTKTRLFSSIFPWNISPAIVTSIVLDIITFELAWYLAIHIGIFFGYGTLRGRNALSQINTYSTAGWTSYILLAAVSILSFFISSGSARPTLKPSSSNGGYLKTQSMSMSGLFLCGLMYYLHFDFISCAIALFTILFIGTILYARRALWCQRIQYRYRRDLDTKNVLVIGSGRAGRALRDHLRSRDNLGFRFKGFLTCENDEGISNDPDILGEITNALAIARSLFIDELIFSNFVSRHQMEELIEQARAVGIGVRLIPDLYETLVHNAEFDYIGELPTISLYRKHYPIEAMFLKRMLDVTLALLMMIILAPLIILIALAVRLDSEGPILYRAQRVGHKGRRFYCYKFRTMVSDADSRRAELESRNERDGILFKITNDPRVTRVGAFLRKYSLDEIPQCVNVLIGDMSLVGPRPSLPVEVEKYELSHLRRLDVIPGITGLWQVEGREDPSFTSYISLDTAYVDNWTFWLDLKILLRTVGVVVRGTGS